MKFREYLLNEKFSTATKFLGTFRGDPEDYIEIYENPTPSEVREMFKDFAKANPHRDEHKGLHLDKYIRGVFDEEGNMFIWVGITLHQFIIQFLSQKDKMKGKETLRFVYEMDKPTDVDIFNPKWLKEAKKHLTEKQIWSRLKTAFPQASKFVYNNIPN